MAHLGSIWSQVGSHFWSHFGTKIGPRGAKIGPRGPSRTPKYRKPKTAKTLKNLWFFNVIGGPRPSKTASGDPRRLPRGYLGFLGAILSHLGAILKTRTFKRAPAGSARAAPSPKWLIWGSILGPQIGLKISFSGVVFWTICLTTFGQFLGPFWGPFWDQIGPRRGQDEPKRPIESFKNLKTCICKNIKKPSVF